MTQPEVVGRVRASIEVGCVCQLQNAQECATGTLAARCRQSADQSGDVVSRTGLLRMVAAYDRKAVEAECVQILVQARDRPAQLRWTGIVR